MKLLLVLFLSLFTLAAFGQVVPETINAGQLLLELVTDYKTMGPLGMGMTAVLLTVWLLKTKFLGSIFKALSSPVKRVVVVVLGQVYGLLYMVQSGMGWGEAAISGIFMAGGAMAIYEAIKPLLPSKK